MQSSNTLGDLNDIIFRRLSAQLSADFGFNIETVMHAVSARAQDSYWEGE